MGTWFALLTPLWLLGLIFPPLLRHEYEDLIQFVTLSWIFAFGLIAGGPYFLYGPVYRREPLIRLLTLLFLVVTTVSALLSEHPLLSLGYVAITVIALICCGGIWYCLYDKLEQCLAIFAVLGTILIGYVYLTTEPFQGRLTWAPYSPPNHLALVSFGILGSALIVRNRLLLVAMVTVNFAAILATQGRGLLLASVLTVCVYFHFVCIVWKKRKGILIGYMLFTVLITASLLYVDTIEATLTDVLLLQDTYRGVGTGFTGRVDAWREAFQMFLDNPVFGVGYRLHERYMTTLSSAHSGYLALLAETGLVGFLVTVSLTLYCMRRLYVSALAGDRLAVLGLSIAVGYLFLIIFERFFINMGNPTSVLVWMLLLLPYRRSPARASGYAGGAC